MTKPAAPAVRSGFIWNHCVEHFVIKNVTKEPGRHERLIEKWIDPDYAVFFLDGAENKIFFRAPFPFPAPDDFVAAKFAAEISFVQPIEVRPQIEVSSFVLEVELPLHRQLRVADLSFCFLRHVLPFTLLDHPDAKTFYRPGITTTSKCAEYFSDR